MKPMILIVSLLCLAACGGWGHQGTETCDVTAERPYNVTPSMMPLPGFVLHAGGAEVCYAANSNVRADTCGQSIFMICGPEGGGDFTYCPAPNQQVEYRIDPTTSLRRLYCRL